MNALDGVWVDCPHCDDGAVLNDCFEDSCCCVDPVAEHGFRDCEVCGGKGGYYPTKEALEMMEDEYERELERNRP